MRSTDRCSHRELGGSTSQSDSITVVVDAISRNLRMTGVHGGVCIIAGIRVVDGAFGDNAGVYCGFGVSIAILIFIFCFTCIFIFLSLFYYFLRFLWLY